MGEPKRLTEWEQTMVDSTPFTIEDILTLREIPFPSEAQKERLLINCAKAAGAPGNKDLTPMQLLMMALEALAARN